MKKIIKTVLCVLLLLSIAGCKTEEKDDIIIIYTSDVHCAIDDNIGYAGLVAYKKQAQEKSKYVTMVDVGDFSQGTALATASEGKAPVECLNVVNYDLQAIGNHEFDYGIGNISNMILDSGGTFINSNIVYTGKNEDNILNSLDKYKIVEYGDIKVGYIALLTPYTLMAASPADLKEDGEVVVDFFGGRSDKDLFAYAQEVVDECKANGADYVVALAHMGSGESDEPYTSSSLAAKTKGIDVIIDAHSHLQFSCKSLLNSEQKEVLVTSCGKNLESIGQVTISNDGLINVTNIVEYDQKDEETLTKINEIKEKYTAQLKETLFVNETPLTIYDEAGIRTIRNKEMPIGDFVADAYRYATGGDIGISNGGGIRADLSVGEVCYEDFMDVTPFGNIMAAIELTGQEIVDYLEYVYRYTQVDYASDGKNICEYGSFMQVSGMKLTIDTSVAPDVVVDEEDNLLEVGEKRRVKDVYIENANGEYEPIDLEKTYVVSCNDYSLLNGGSGSEVFFEGKKVVISDAGADYEALYTYAKDVLNFDLSRYATSANRITIE